MITTIGDRHVELMPDGRWRVARENPVEVHYVHAVRAALDLGGDPPTLICDCESSTCADVDAVRKARESRQALGLG